MTMMYTWEKVLKNGPSKDISASFTWSMFEYVVPYMNYFSTLWSIDTKYYKSLLETLLEAL